MASFSSCQTMDATGWDIKVPVGKIETVGSVIAIDDEISGNCELARASQTHTHTHILWTSVINNSSSYKIPCLNCHPGRLPDACRVARLRSLTTGATRQRWFNDMAFNTTSGSASFADVHDAPNLFHTRLNPQFLCACREQPIAEAKLSSRDLQPG